MLVRRYGFTPEYVDGMPPAERDVYLAIGEQEAKEEQEAIEASQGKMSNSNIMNLVSRM